MAKVLVIVSLHSGCLPSQWKLRTKRHVLVGPKAINRQNEKGKLWLPKKSSKVCEHFVSRKPTKDNADPELNLGYKAPLYFFLLLSVAGILIHVKETQGVILILFRT